MKASQRALNELAEQADTGRPEVCPTGWTRRYLAAVIGILALGALLQTGCGTPRRGEPLKPALNVLDPHIANGQRVFMANCNPCHPGGEGGLGPSLNEKPLPAFGFKTQVRHGLGTMPAFGKDKISPQDLDDLVLYLKMLRQS